MPDRSKQETESQRRRRIALIACRCCNNGVSRVRPAVVNARSHDAAHVEFATDLAAVSSVLIEETLGVTGKVEYRSAVNGGEMPRGGA